jgi:hypothetical protein
MKKIKKKRKSKEQIAKEWDREWRKFEKALSSLGKAF